MVKDQKLLIHSLRAASWLVAFCYSATVTFAATSPGYQIDSDQVGPNQFRQSSSNYIIDGSIDTIVGQIDGTAYNVEQGSGTRIEADGVVVNPGGGGGGGNNCSAPTNFTVASSTCNRAYKNLTVVKGTKDNNTSFVFINNDLSGVSFPTPTTWNKMVFLQPGENKLEIYAQNDCGLTTEKIMLILQKLRMGDVNNDGKTDDYDLSLLTRKWTTAKDCFTDFNKDDVTDDYDLSLLAAAWSR